MKSDGLPELRLNDDDHHKDRRQPGWGPEGPDPFREPHFYESISVKRIIAYICDLVLIAFLAFAGNVAAALIGLMSFGLLYGPMMALLVLLPLAYHTYFLGGAKSATLGMRFLGIEARTLSGDRLTYLQALIQTALFYFSVGATGSFILIWALFNPRRRCLHDLLSGTLIVVSQK